MGKLLAVFARVGLSALLSLAIGAQAFALDARYKLNGGEVLDEKTGLIWQRCSSGETWTGAKCAGGAKLSTWAEAMGARENGGWRLPSKDELMSLYDFAKQWQKGPKIDITVFPDIGHTELNQYWTSTTVPCVDSSNTHLGCAFSVNFVDNTPEPAYPNYHKQFRFHVRLVRFGKDIVDEPYRPVSAAQGEGQVVAGRFVLHGGEAFDQKTGLTWQRCDANKIYAGDMGCKGTDRLYPLEEARKLGAEGWRLPTRDELLTIVDKSRAGHPPLLERMVFLDVHADEYWTSTRYDARNDQVWCVNFALGSPGNCGPFPKSARLVRGAAGSSPASKSPSNITTPY